VNLEVIQFRERKIRDQVSALNWACLKISRNPFAVNSVLGRKGIGNIRKKCNFLHDRVNDELRDRLIFSEVRVSIEHRYVQGEGRKFNFKPPLKNLDEGRRVWP